MAFTHSRMFRQAGVNIHVICTGAGAGLQKMLWDAPGASDYLSGASFPYRPKETDTTLGFVPESYCSRETAVDLACVAFGRAYTFGEKRPIGLGLTASVASEREHRGEHRIHACVISEGRVLVSKEVLAKGVGPEAREADGHVADTLGLSMLATVIDPNWEAFGRDLGVFEDGTALAIERFFKRPFFAKNGSRSEAVPKGTVFYPGSYYPPHPGHFSVASAVEDAADAPVVFHVTSDGPHKAPLSVQDLLKRARMLRGHDRVFTRGDALYLDKARAHPGASFALGADALRTMLDPKWGQPIVPMLYEMSQLGVKFYVVSRRDGDELLTLESVLDSSGIKEFDLLLELFVRVDGDWDYSSTKERARVLGA